MAKNKFADLLGEVGIGTSGAAGTTGEPVVPKMGKRSDPSYRQISTYVRSDLYLSVKRELLMEERDFSDLLDELLNEWLTARKGK